MSKSPSLGTFIRERRHALGLTQDELAERIGGRIGQAEVSRLENDRIALPRRGRMMAIATALEVSLGELLVRTGWMDKDLLGESDEQAVDGAPAEIVSEVLVPKDLDTLPVPELVSLLDRIGEAQDQVTATSIALEASRKAVTAELHEHVDDDGAPRPEASPPIGIVDDQEIMVAFVA